MVHCIMVLTLACEKNTLLEEEEQQVRARRQRPFRNPTSYHRHHSSARLQVLLRPTRPHHLRSSSSSLFETNAATARLHRRRLRRQDCLTRTDLPLPRLAKQEGGIILASACNISICDHLKLTEQAIRYTARLGPGTRQQQRR